MLQTRLENEQFNTLPNIYPKSQSQNSFLSNDRPDSSQLVDLHIYVIPTSVWKNIQHFAQNEAMDEARSAGFIRVPPDMKLYNLRQAIEKLCRTENYFPRDFIFLRSVGRGLTRVKLTQENELKVKNYRPPQTSAPEIYLIEGRHEDYRYIPSASPSRSSANYLFGNRYQHRFNFADYGPSTSSKLSHTYHREPLNTDEHKLPILPINTSTSRLSSSGRISWKKFPQADSDLEDSTSISSVRVNYRSVFSRGSGVSNTASRGLAKLQEEQERLRQRQAELERMRLAAEEKKLQSDRNQHHRQEKVQSEHKNNEQQRQEKLLSERKENERRRQEKEKSEREQQEQRRRQEKIEAEHQRKLKQDNAAAKIQASFRGFKERQAFRERQINIIKNDTRILSSNSNTIINEKKMDINDDELSDGEILSRSSSIGSTSGDDDDDDSSVSRPKTRILTRESISSNSSSLLSMKSERKISSNISSYSKTKDNIDDDDEINRTVTVTKIRHPTEELVQISTPDINHDDDDTYEVERRQAEIRRRRHQEEEKRKPKDVEEQGQHESLQRQPKQQQQQHHDDPESLRNHLQEVRKNCVDLKKNREEAISNLKSIYSRLTTRRKEARDMWKKKYFQEKKRNSPIEHRITELNTELDKIHKKVEEAYTNEPKHSAKTNQSKETETSENYLLQITRIQHEMQGLHQQIDQSKLRLTTDIKLRNQADNECRVLKHELDQTKINFNSIKSRIGI
ncbi:unnamed protein product [Adineta steineri]|uniref:Spermatogenesis-associated protein 1 C-terminal domain-containing protein n=2 Tax=Adineta steineri TaxID=433720 RepID=A0A814MGH3_9BILA|nr:unnamed protein product [Adineta steineri]CAF3506879.1 unnamed protein product [Adineta steineri]